MGWRMLRSSPSVKVTDVLALRLIAVTSKGTVVRLGAEVVVATGLYLIRKSALS